MRLSNWLVCLAVSVGPALLGCGGFLLQADLEVTLAEVRCSVLALATRCSAGPQPQNASLSLIRREAGNATVVSRDWIPCASNSSALVATYFPLACRGLYQVNVSLQTADAPYASPVWWLGGRPCSPDDGRDCAPARFLHPLNRCAASSAPCQSANATAAPSVASTFAEWTPELALVAASCSSVTVRATCPRLADRRHLTFNLVRARTDVLLRTASVQCAPRASDTVYASLLLECQAHYRVNVSLSPARSSLACDEFCSRAHQSAVWLLGRAPCGPAESARCVEDRFLSALNNCSAAVPNRCSTAWTFSAGLAILTAVLAALVLLAILVTLYFMGSCCRRPFAYRRTTDEILVFQSDEV